MKKITDLIPEGTKSVALIGHVRPDGDCLGSVMGLYHYLCDNMPALSVDVYLSDITHDIMFMTEGERILSEPSDQVYDLALSLDVSSTDRIGAGKEAFEKALHTAAIDHHATNPGFAEENYIIPDAVSCSEVVYTLLDPEKVGLQAATCLYTGIIHDSGVFRYSDTKPETLRIAADLIEKGVPFSSIILHSVTERDYDEIMITMRILKESVFLRDERILTAAASSKLQAEYGKGSKDLGFVVSDLNTVRGAEVILFTYQFEDGSWKGSLRSKEIVNVAKIAQSFGGGGHIHAAGFSFADGEMDQVISKVRLMVKDALTS